MKVIELKQKRAELVKQARDILDLVDKEKRAMTADENTNYENLDAEIDRLTKQIDREERLAAREAELAAQERTSARPVIENPDATETRANPRATPEFRRAFNSWLRGGLGEMRIDEVRALQANSNAAGGFLVPDVFVTELIKFIDDSVFVRQFATKFQLGQAESMGAPSLDADPADADWTSEIATGSEDTAMAFGRRELHPHPLAKRIKVSNKLLRVSPMDPETMVRQRLAYKFAVSEEKGFLTGNGANQPLGLFTASADGISTGRDVQTGSSTDITADGLIDALYSLKEGYMRNARWMFHRDGIKRIRKLKDSQNQYLWQPGLSNGQPNTILDKPYVMSEYVPNTFTSAKYVGIVGDLSFYWIADALSMTVQRLVELYAETNQTGFIGRLETDGMPVLEEAFARLKTN